MQGSLGVSDSLHEAMSPTGALSFSPAAEWVDRMGADPFRPTMSGVSSTSNPSSDPSGKTHSGPTPGSSHAPVFGWLAAAAAAEHSSEHGPAVPNSPPSEDPKGLETAPERGSERVPERVLVSSLLANLQVSTPKPAAAPAPISARPSSPQSSTPRGCACSAENGGVVRGAWSPGPERRGCQGGSAGGAGGVSSAVEGRNTDSSGRGPAQSPSPELPSTGLGAGEARSAADVAASAVGDGHGGELRDAPGPTRRVEALAAATAAGVGAGEQTGGAAPAGASAEPAGGAVGQESSRPASPHAAGGGSTGGGSDGGPPGQQPLKLRVQRLEAEKRRRAAGASGKAGWRGGASALAASISEEGSPSFAGIPAGAGVPFGYDDTYGEDAGGAGGPVFAPIVLSMDSQDHYMLADEWCAHQQVIFCFFAAHAMLRAAFVWDIALMLSADVFGNTWLSAESWPCFEAYGNAV